MSRWLLTLRQPRWAALSGIALVVIAGFSLSVRRAREVAPPPALAESATTTTALSSFSDSYHKGAHTFSGTLVVPTPCVALSASAVVDASSSSPRVRIHVSVSRDTGTCLQLPTGKSFSVKAQAPANAPVDVYVNGTSAALPPASP